MRLLVEAKYESDDGSVSVQSKTRVRCSHGEVVLGITMASSPAQSMREEYQNGASGSIGATIGVAMI